MNRIEIALTNTKPSDWNRAANKAARAAAKAAGIAWTDADVLVILPEAGRCFTKAAGFQNLTAHG